MITTKEDLVKLLCKRDNLELEEAQELVDSVQEQIKDLIGVETDSPYGLFEVIQDLIQDELGLEPDYMDLFLEDAI